MKTQRLLIHSSLAILPLLTVSGIVPTARADEAELNRRIDILSSEIEKLKAGEANSSDGAQTKGDKGAKKAEGTSSNYGMDGSAGKVYNSHRSVSFGGYGEMLYQSFGRHQENGDLAPIEKTDNIDFLRNVLYVGYKFNDSWIFNSELEVEHAVVASDKGGEFEVEFAYLDYLMSPQFNLRVGMVLVPMGLTNETHEPTSYLSARRPDVETFIIPTTWRENGFGFFGEVGPFTYRTYLLAGLNADRFAPDTLAEGRQEGVESKTKDSYGWVTRVDYSATPGLLVGGAAYMGRSASYNDGGTNATGAVTGPTIGTQIYEGHLEWKWHGLDIRSLATIVKLDGIATYNRARGYSDVKALGQTLWGQYAQVGYDVLSLTRFQEASLTPFVRWESYDTQANVPKESGQADPGHTAKVWTYGIALKPIEQITFKADYQNYQIRDRSGVNQFNVSMGYNY